MNILCVMCKHVKFIVGVILLTLISFFAPSCTKHNITINGVVSPDLGLERREVTLIIDNGNEVKPYYTIVENNTFSLTKHIPFEQVTVLEVADFGQCVVCLEEGEIYVELLSDSIGSQLMDQSQNLPHNLQDAAHVNLVNVYGTRSNDLVSYYLSRHMQLEDYYMQLAPENADTAYVDSLYRDFVDDAFELTLSNLDCIGGKYILTLLAPALTYEQLTAIFDSMPEDDKHSRYVKPVYDFYLATKTE